MTEENYKIIIDNLREDFKTLRKVDDNQWDAINRNTKQLSSIQKLMGNIDSRLKFIESKYKESVKDES